MTETPTPTIAEDPTGAAAAPASVRDFSHEAGELEEIQRELAADPCHLVRRACQVADYEWGGAAPPKDGR